MPCPAARSSTWSTRSRNRSPSTSHSRSCRNSRMEFIPIPAAQPSSRSIVAGSNVAACHSSNWFDAVDGVKLQPTSQPTRSRHSSARTGVHRARSRSAAAGTNPRVAAALPVRSRTNSGIDVTGALRTVGSDEIARRYRSSGPAALEVERIAAGWSASPVPRSAHPGSTRSARTFRRSLPVAVYGSSSSTMYCLGRLWPASRVRAQVSSAAGSTGPTTAAQTR